MYCLLKYFTKYNKQFNLLRLKTINSKNKQFCKYAKSSYLLTQIMTYRKLEKVAEASCGVQQSKKIKLTPKKRFDLNYKIKHL